MILLMVNFTYEIFDWVDFECLWNRIKIYMQNLDFSKLVQVKLDLSVVQDALSQTIQDIVTRVSNLEINNEKISLTITKTSQETHKLYEII